MTDPDIVSLLITLRLAAVTTILLILIGTPLAWFLSSSTHFLRNLIEPIVALPIVLPPTVVGFYLLIAFSPQSMPGQIWQSATGSTLAFSFTGLVIGSIIYSLPFYVQPLQVAFTNLREATGECA